MLRRLTATVIAAAALLAPATSAQAAPFVARLKAGTHTPKANRLWPITVTAQTSSGKALRATAVYQFVYNRQVVATRWPSPHANPRSACSKAGNCRKTPYPFNGRFRDGTFIWPARAAGVDLTFRVVVSVKGKGHVNLDYNVRVRR
jgi:hypothetical protein